MALAHYLLAELLHICFVGYTTAECNGCVGGIALPERGAERQDWRQGIVAVAAPPFLGDGLHFLGQRHDLPGRLGGEMLALAQPQPH